MTEHDQSGVTPTTGGGLNQTASSQLPSPRTGARTISTADQTRLHVREWGVGLPVLFVHSWALESSMWAYQFLEFGHSGLRCIAYDRRGHGRSDRPSSGYDLDSLADDLAAVIDQLDLRDVVLVGHSMGCNEIVRYVARHATDRVRKVILLAPTTPYLTQAPDNPSGIPEAVLNELRAEWGRDFPGWIEANKEPFFTEGTSPALMNWLAGMMMAADLPAAVACNVAAAGTDLRSDLRAIDRPTLVIHGDRDVSAPLDLTGRATAAGIAGALLKIYPGAPHGLFVTHLAQINRDILDFALAS